MATCAAAQNDDGLNNPGLTNNSNVANQLGTPRNNNSNVQAGMQQQFSGSADFSQFDNNIGVPQQAAQPAPVSDPKKERSITFDLPKPSFAGSGGSSRSSGRRRTTAFSKRIKKFNRRMNYVLSKKGKKTFAVDYCFAWK